MHHCGIVLASENVTGPAHIGGQLVYFFYTRHRFLCNILVAEVANYKFVRWRGTVFVVFQIYSTHPIAFCFESFHEVAADEATGSCDKNAFL